MQKIYFYIVLLFVFLSTFIFGACESDDICLEETTTPQLIIRFYDKDDTTSVKVVDSLYVWATDKDSLYTGQETDSIVLPFNLNADEITYQMSNGIAIDSLTIRYLRKEVFLSRSCGYIMNFELQDDTQTSQNWIDELSIVAEESEVNNETEAHVKIFH